jgi:hypothetical protein
MPELSFYSDQDSCSACGRPPVKEKKLSTCRNCKSASYHDAACQKSHWKLHKRECKILKKSIRPLVELVTYTGSTWWMIEANDEHDSEYLWKQSCQQWYQQDYLQAMKGFQLSLEPYDRSWNKSIAKENITNSQTSEIRQREEAVAWKLARRFLFCSYCELDGNQIESARHHLVLAVSLLVNTQSVNNNERNSVFSDVWMELMLSFEEETNCRRLARHVAHMAIQTGNYCGWKHAIQRPGYMVTNLVGISHTPRQNHPAWCRMLEEHWKTILDEYSTLAQHNSLSVVGEGDRGSGYDDHRVVAPGSNWTEYVLFGTGSRHGETPLTKRLLQQYVPDAVSLAQLGGGEVIFSRLAPGSHIQAHCGPTNFRWTAHLGLVVPKSSENCQIRVGNQWYSWETGKIFLFDDSFEHQVRNDTEQERVVLLMRLWHPKLAPGLREQVLYKARQKKDAAVEKRYHPPK